jgi:predicted nucleic acid-binding protein
VGTVKALDADVLIGFLDPDDAHHAAAVARLSSLLATREPLIAAASVYAEILVHAAAGPRRAVVDDFLDDARIEVVPIDRATAASAAELRAAHRSLRLPDALSLATALLHDAELVTFDRRLRRIAAAQAT